MKLLIRNLARTTTEADLRAMFEVYGTVQSCTLVIDKATGNSKGFGFIEMPKAYDAKLAIKKLNGEDVAGNKIRVKRAEPKKENSKKEVPKKAELKKEENTSKDLEQDKQSSKQDPLHGITLEMILTRLVEKYGWEELGERIKIKCFMYEPSIKSSLNFLRKTQWAREKVQALYLNTSWQEKKSIWPS